MNKTKAVLIDDMELARKALRADLTALCPEIEIVGEADGVISGSKLIRKIKPDIIFLDIHLNDGDGFDIIELCEGITAKIIFTTASDEHAIKAFQFSAIDYLLKPLDPELLVSAVNKAIADQDIKDYSTVKDNYHSPNKLVLHTAELIKIAGISEIIRLESMGNYTYFYFDDGSKLLITKTLKEYHNILSGSDFLRVHQSHLINLHHLKSYVKTEGGYLLMQDKSRIPVSVRKKTSVLQALEDFAS